MRTPKIHTQKPQPSRGRKSLLGAGTLALLGLIFVGIKARSQRAQLDEIGAKLAEWIRSTSNPDVATILKSYTGVFNLDRQPLQTLADFRTLITDEGDRHLLVDAYNRLNPEETIDQLTADKLVYGQHPNTREAVQRLSAPTVAQLRRAHKIARARRDGTIQPGGFTRVEQGQDEDDLTSRRAG